nr:MAG TPA: Cell-membrane associated Mucin15 [Caudoviricetes sp.]
MDVTITIPQLIGGFVAALGIPSAIMGLVTWRIKKRAEKRAAEAEEREDAREQLLLMLVESVGAALALGEATARAVQRIPDAHCNGDMHAALDYAVSIKHKQRDFLSTQGVRSTF